MAGPNDRTADDVTQHRVEHADDVDVEAEDLKQIHTKGADHAANFLGNQHVEVTEEDVRTPVA